MLKVYVKDRSTHPILVIMVNIFDVAFNIVISFLVTTEVLHGHTHHLLCY